jgi:hypothetical protein
MAHDNNHIIENSSSRRLVFHNSSPAIVNGLWISEPGLLLTCKQARDEANPIFHLENHFDFCVIESNSRPLEMWLKKCDGLKLGGKEVQCVFGIGRIFQAYKCEEYGWYARQSHQDTRWDKPLKVVDDVS